MVKSQFSSVAQSCPTLHDPMNRSTPGLPVHHQLPEFTKLTSIESVMPSSHLILCRPLLLLPPSPPSIRVFSNESTLHMRWPKYWSFSFRSFLPKKSQGWSPSEWTCWISFQSKGTCWILNIVQMSLITKQKQTRRYRKQTSSSKGGGIN